jgi:hypothetical protein
VGTWVEAAVYNGGEVEGNGCLISREIMNFKYTGDIDLIGYFDN